MRAGHRRLRAVAHRGRGLPALSARRLVLWDIDGTLLQGAAEAHKRAIHLALEEVHGADTRAVRVQTSGKTDGEICRELLLGAGVDEPSVVARAADVRAAACRAYAELVDEDLSHCLAPAVGEVLPALAARSDLVHTLVTGNLEPIARLKLGRAGIAAHFAEGQGGYGSDSDLRSDLPRIARERAGAVLGAGTPWPREHTVVIGDTPRDIACARADGVRVIAVATGMFTPHQLTAADTVIRTLRDLEL